MGGASGSASALPCPGFSASDFFVSVATLRRFLSGFVFSISQSRTKHGIRVVILRRVAKTGFRGSDFLLRSISVFFSVFPGFCPKSLRKTAMVQFYTGGRLRRILLQSCAGYRCRLNSFLLQLHAGCYIITNI